MYIIMIFNDLITDFWVNGENIQMAEGNLYWYALYNTYITATKPQKSCIHVFIQHQFISSELHSSSNITGKKMEKKGKLCILCSLSTRSHQQDIKTLTLLTTIDCLEAIRRFNMMVVQGTLCPFKRKSKD